MRGAILHRALFALTMLAVIVGTDAGAQTAPTPPQPIPPLPSPPWVALVSALAWPVAAFVIALAFRARIPKV
jgi:hypothetical protein